MQDRFTRGFIGGVIGMLFASIPNIIAYSMGISLSRYLDVATTLLWGELPKNTWEAILGWGITVAFCGLLGVVFAYLLAYLGSQNFLFKGIVFGAAGWFLLHAVGSLFKLPLLAKSTPQTLIVHLLSAIVYGAVTGYFLAWADRRIVTTDRASNHRANFSVASPAYKLHDESKDEGSKSKD